MTVPYIFATATGNVALAELDANFAAVGAHSLTADYANVANSVSGDNVSGTVGHSVYSDYAAVANAVSGDNVVGPVSFANISNVAFYADYANTLSQSSLSLAGNVTAQFFIGTLLGNISNAVYADTANYAYYANRANTVAGPNVSGYVANAVHATVANTANSVTGAHVSGQVANALVAGTVYTSDQPNITSLGNLISVTATTAQLGDITFSGNSITPGTRPLELASDVTVGGNLQVLGNVTYVNSNNVSTGNLIINLAASALTPAAANSAGIQIGNTYFANVLYSSTQNAWILSNTVIAPGFSSTGTVIAAKVSATGNVSGGNLVTNGVAALGGWNITPSGNKLYFSYGTSQVGSLDNGGNFVVTGNITAFGTP
jgi:hypothetical protein